MDTLEFDSLSLPDRQKELQEAKDKSNEILHEFNKKFMPVYKLIKTLLSAYGGNNSYKDEKYIIERDNSHFYPQYSIYKKKKFNLLLSFCVGGSIAYDSEYTTEVKMKGTPNDIIEFMLHIQDKIENRIEQIKDDNDVKESLNNFNLSIS